MAITCWHVGTAFIMLLQASRIHHLRKFANEDLDILVIAAKELQKMWASANVIVQGFDRIRNQDTLISASNTCTQLVNTVLGNTTDCSSRGSSATDITANEGDDFDWMRFFPFVSKSTNGIAESLVNGRERGTATRNFLSSNNGMSHDTMLAQYQDLFFPLMTML